MSLSFLSKPVLSWNHSSMLFPLLLFLLCFSQVTGSLFSTSNPYIAAGQWAPWAYYFMSWQACVPDIESPLQSQWLYIPTQAPLTVWIQRLSPRIIDRILFPTATWRNQLLQDLVWVVRYTLCFSIHDRLLIVDTFQGVLYDRGLSCQLDNVSNTPVPALLTDQNKIALVKRGNCTFTDKVLYSQMDGAVGVIIYNNIPFEKDPHAGIMVTNRNTATTIMLSAKTLTIPFRTFHLGISISQFIMSTLISEWTY